MKKQITLILALLAFQAADAQNLSMYQEQQFMYQTDIFLYRILYPEGFDVNKKYPRWRGFAIRAKPNLILNRKFLIQLNNVISSNPFCPE